jgi:pimeloyl-ACP methyl ester carboxylesterase
MLKSIWIHIWFCATICLLTEGSLALAGNNAGQAFSLWPDTGQTTCFDADGNVLNPCPAPGEPYHGQDAQYYGPARSYTKLDASGNAMPESATSWAMIQDNVTGLIWEAKEAKDSVKDYANPHDADNTYTWCDTDPDTNGNYAGTCGANDTMDFLSALNSGAGFAGHTDWRLPTLKELKTLIDRSRHTPSISTIYFPNTISDYWSSTADASNFENAWFVRFIYGYDFNINKYQSYSLRAVRGGQTSPEIRYVINGDTVFDSITCLEWQRSAADISGDGVPDAMTWQSALSYTEGLSLEGADDWRLPDINELASIVDYSRNYPAIDTAVFPDTVSSSFWSSTTNALYNTRYAWEIGFDRGLGRYNYKGYNGYVRAVRGRQCGLAEGIDHLSIDPVASPQPVDSPVQVTVRAIDRSGQPMTTFAGQVTLIANGPGMIITDRTQSGEVTVFTVIFGKAYASNQLHAQSGSLYGDSNVFDVGSVASSEVYSVKGRVEDSSGNAIAATVHLQDTAHDFQAITVNGDFEFTADQHIPAGRYTLWTELLGIRYDFEVNLGTGINKVGTLVTREAKPAVILVPGFMGSNARENGGTVYPELPINKPIPRNSLILHDPFKKPGWRKLREDLETAGFEVFDCPWDWRLPPDDKDAQLALKNTIAEAKRTTGATKVDIVAHSMGGLLARAYIQSSDYAGDIDRFAMVGTPNHGSLLAYPGWEGGDTVLADFMAGNSGGYQCNFNPLSNIADYFYSQTLDKLYAKMKGGHSIQFYEYLICGLRPEPQPKKDLNQIRDFIHEDVAGLGSLLSTNYYCLKSVSKSCGQVSPPYRNTFLTALNADSDRDRLTNGTVNTKLFASNAEETMQIVDVKLGDGIFQDGTPQRPFSPTENAGDGTVLYSSAQLGVPTHPSTSKGEHAFLVNKFRTEISEFLTSGRILTPASPRYIPLAATQPVSQLALSVDNGYAALLTGPDNARNGIDLEVPVEFEESVGANLLRDGNVASVILTDPATGVYEVKLTGNLTGTARSVVAWMDENQSEELVVNVYHNPSATSFRFKVDPTADPVLSLVVDIGQPENPAAKKSGDTTALQWSAPTVGTAASYKVYRRQDFQNDFMLLDSVIVPTTSLVTTDPYNDPRVIYAVSAVDSLGNESVLSEIIDNQPVVYTNHEYRRFPWAMFLPALNNKK